MPARTHKMLVRDFVFHSLYAPEVGYFQQPGDVVGSLRDRAAPADASEAAIEAGRVRQGLDFNDMLGETEYRHTVAQHYSQGGSAWLTPSELFHPWYAAAVARFVVEQLRAQSPGGVGVGGSELEGKVHAGSQTKKLRVIEIGGGNGTFALGFADYLQVHHPKIYQDLEYTLVEVSEKLAAMQRARVCSRHGAVSVVVADGTDAATIRALNWGPTDDEAVFFMGFEVLDNMPHDKIVVGDDGVVRQAVVRRPDGSEVLQTDWQAGGGVVEELEPLTDGWIQACLQASGGGGVPEVAGVAVAWGGANRTEDRRNPNEDFRRHLKGLWHRVASRVGLDARKEVFVPTKAFAFLSALAESFPAATVLLADFDQLPDAIAGVNGPVVQSKEDGRSSFHATYLVPPGTADIFHPTDFGQLQNMFRFLTGVEGHIFSHRDFALRYGDLNKTATMSGYNPLVEDYSNMAMFVSQLHNSNN